jgi:hypothetical protein
MRSRPAPALGDIICGQRELADRIRPERTRAVTESRARFDPDDRGLLEAALPALERLADELAGGKR